MTHISSSGAGEGRTGVDGLRAVLERAGPTAFVRGRVNKIADWHDDLSWPFRPHPDSYYQCLHIRFPERLISRHRDKIRIGLRNRIYRDELSSAALAAKDGR